jgi:hypothetical protein
MSLISLLSLIGYGLLTTPHYRDFKDVRDNKDIKLSVEKKSKSP